ncbi:hypothetical protein [Amycolatopsis sp. cmx-4-68]|uniref:hypothetical protein n=1 Tax=Amycolatopsis sp. cmx-4-68 TaxID=2790938 RepID=UPI00397CA5EC
MSSHQPLDGAGWTDQRRKLHTLLADRHPLLADYFASAVYFLTTPDAPARMSHLGHAIRELCNHMPDAVNVARLDRSNTENRIPALAKAWDAAELPDSADELLPCASSAGEADMCHVPRTVMAAAADLVASTRIRGSNRRRAVLMIVDPDAPEEETVAESDPTVTRWVEIIARQMPWVHAFDKKPSQISEEQLADDFGFLEEVMCGVLAPLDAASDLDDLLAQTRPSSPSTEQAEQPEATSPDQEATEWPVPTPEQLDRFQVLGSHARRLWYFFERLENPLWLKPLAERGWFDVERVPEPLTTDAGVQLSDWPQALYLARVAGKVPETAARIIDAIAGTTNPLVHRHLVDAVLALPAADAAPFIGSVLAWVRGPRAVWLDPGRLAELTTVFLRSGVEGAETLALALLDSVEDQYVTADVATALCAPLAETGITGVAVFADALEQHADPERHLDLVNYRRSSIASRGPQAPYDATDPLIDGLRDAALAYTRRTGQPDVIDFLLARPSALYRRIAYYVAAALCGQSDTDTSKEGVDGAEETVAPPIRARAKEMVMDESALRDSATLLEYGNLVSSAVGHLDQIEVETLAAWLRAGPHLDKDLIRWLTADESQPAEDILAAFADRWREERLALFGPELPGPLQAIRDDLRARGVEQVQHPGISHVTYRWPSAESPLTAAELAGMPVPQVIATLAEQTPSPTRQFDTPEAALANQLAADIRTRPSEYTAHASSFIEVSPLYVAKLIDELQLVVHAAGKDAPAEGFSLDLAWDELLAACAAIAGRSDAGEPDAQHAPDSPRWLQRRVANLIDTILTLAASVVTPERADTILTAIELLLASPDPTITDEADDEALSDPGVRSINSVRGIAIDIVMEFIRWRCRLGDSEAAIPARIVSLLDRHLDVEHDPSPAVRSVYGQHIRLLYHAMPDWTRAHVAAIFGDPVTGTPFAASQPDVALTLEQRLGQVAFDTYLLAGTTGAELWELLEPFYLQAIRGLSQTPRTRQGSPRDSRQSLLDHVLLFVVWGTLDAEDTRLKTAFRSPHMGDAFTHLGFDLQLTEVLDDDTAGRLRTLWTWWRMRAERRSNGDPDGAARMIAGFHRWWHAGKLGVSWEFDELIAVLKLSPCVEVPSMVVHDMVSRYVGHERQVIEALNIILPNVSVGHLRSNCALKGEPILSGLMRSNDSEVVRLTERLLQTLASWGMIELAQRVAASVT